MFRFLLPCSCLFLVQSFLGQAFALTAEVGDYLGSPTLIINGEPRVPLMFWGHADPAKPDDSPFAQQARLAAGAGIHLHSFQLTAPWPKPGEEPDFSAVDATLESVLLADPEALMLPRFGIYAPHWWLDAHPDDEMVFSDGLLSPDGRVASMASEAYREEGERHLRAFVRHCEERFGEFMAGYHPCGQHTGEWFYMRSWEPVFHGFEEAFRKGFADWALKKRSSVAALGQAWFQPGLTVEGIRVPTAAERGQAAQGHFRDPAKERFLIDFHEYQQVAMVEPLKQFARAIKEETGKKKLVALFYGYTFEISGMPTGPQNSGHLRLASLLESPDIDMVCSPISYGDRALGGTGALMAPVDSVRSAGKLWLTEDDTRTHLSAQSDPYGRVPTLEGSQWVHRRNFGQVLPRRLACWHMDLMNEGWLNDSELWKNIGAMNTAYSKALHRPAQWNPDVAVVIDEKSFLYLADRWEITRLLCANFRPDVYRMGSPFRIHLLSDLLNGRCELPKVTLFIGCFHLSEKERQKIGEESAGKTLVWFYGSGFLNDGSASVRNMEGVTGFQFAEPVAEGPGVVAFEKETLLTQGLEGTKYGLEIPLRPRFALAERAGIQPLARFEDGALAAATQDKDGARQYSIGSLGCPPKLLRNILREAGVWVWLDTDDVVLAGNDFLSVTATTTGEKDLMPPAGKKLIPLEGGDALIPVAGKARVSFAAGETKQYWVE
jgi:hypothetical protein